MARPRYGQRKPGAPSVGRRRRTAAPVKAVVKVPEGMTSNEDFAELLGSLTGKEVKVGSCAPLVAGPASPVVVSVYIDDNGVVGALLVTDVAASAGIAAALTLMPAGAVTEAVRMGELDDNLLENWDEIANICTQTVRLPGFPTFKLKGTIQSSTGLTDDVETLMSSAPFQVGWSVQVPGFSNGKISIFMADPP